VDDLDLEIELLLEADERDHDLGLGLEAGLRRIGGGLEDGAGLHAVISGYLMPRRQPRKPSIGLNSCSSCTRCMIFSTGMPSFRARSICCSLECGRNSCSGGSRKRMVAGKPLQGLEDAEEVARW
jgi:hypothetical protein